MVNDYHYRIAYADTDAGGVVYHGRYLEIAERARLEMLRDCGLLTMVVALGRQRPGDFAATGESQQLVVRHCTIDYRLPVRLDDLVTVRSRVTDWGGASFNLEQTLWVAEELKVTMVVKLACIDGEFRPKRIPSLLRERLSTSS
ncbi:MAG: YbgC/FadM family acyl-CoA thioesterase [Alphaproteobacteria bacterium]|nr:YbgC/FadM family acyl-CoA thioesterase [Alphaproteobacteria bacterium]